MHERGDIQALSRSPHARFFRAVWVALLCLSLGGATAASAGPLADAKAAGWLGERPDGYVGLVRPDAPPDVRSLASEVNAQRARHYEEIAQRNGTTPVAVAVLAGRKLIERTPPGQYVMDDQGRWSRK